MKRILSERWLPVILIALLAVGLAAFFAWPRGEKAPQVVAPEETPREETTPPEGIVWNVPPGQVDPEEEKEIKKAIFHSFPQEAMMWGEEQVILSIEALKMDEEWAMTEYALRYKESGAFVPTEFSWKLLHKTSGRWEIVEGQEALCALLPKVPETVVRSGLREFYLEGCPR